MVRVLQQAGEYTEAFYTHGLGVETAEALAEWMHRRIRTELGLPAGQGMWRASWRAAVPTFRGPGRRTGR